MIEFWNSGDITIISRELRHNGCQLTSVYKRPANLANVGYAVEKKNTTAQSHNQGGRL
jgi:hypothetical protein